MRSRLAVIFAAVPVLLLNGPAVAETEQQPEEVYSEEVVVTATRTETPVEQLGSSVTILTSEDLGRRQTRLLVDALQSVPGLDLRRTGGPGSATSIFIRGADSDQTLVLLDGVEMNDPSTPNRLPFLDHLTSDGIERVEIIRGPQSTLYGGDAIGGVINIITRKGAGGPLVRVTGEAGSFSTVRGAVSGGGSSDSFDYSFDAARLKTDNFSASASGTEDDPYHNSSASGRFGWSFGEDGRLDVIARHMDGQIHFDGFVSEEGNRIDSEQTLLKVQPRFTMHGGRWSQRVALQAIRHRRETRSAFPSLFKGRLFALEWGNDFRLDEQHTLTVGLEGERQEADFTGFEDHAHTEALYAQDQISLGSRFFGTVGFRVDDHSLFGTKTTYRLTGARHFGAGTILRGSFGTGFKAPSLSELNQSAFAGNPDLDAETSTGFDLGFSQKLAGGRGSIGATYFQNDIDDLIVAVFDPGSGSFLNLNVDEAEVRGAEFSFTARAGEQVALAGNYTYTGTEATGQPQGFGLSEGSSLLRRPRNKASLDLRIDSRDAATAVTLTGLYVGERNDIDPVSFAAVKADDYLLFNLACSYDIRGTLQLFGRIDNLLDKEYEDVLGFQTAKISFFVGLTTVF